MSAVKAWNECKASFGAQIRKDSLLEHAVKEAHSTLERIRHQTMSEQKSVLLRQQTGILFSCAETSVKALLAAGEPQVWFQAEEKNKIELQLTRFIPAALFFVFLCVAAILRILTMDVAGMILLGGAVLCTIYERVSRVIRMRRLKEKSNQMFKIEQHIDPDRLIMLFDKLTNEIDRHIEELAYLESSRTQDDVDTELLDLCSNILEACRSGEQPAAVNVLPSVEQYIIHHGIQIVDYSRDTEQYFDVMPAKKGERTIIPALLKNGRILRKGVAAVCSGQQP